MQLPSRLSALRHPQFLRYWLASFLSVGAVQLQIMGLGWLVFELSGSTLALGYLGAALGLPAILITLFGGVLADRLDKRKLMLMTSAGTAVLLALLAWLDYSGLAAVWSVISIAAGISIINGVDWPARNAIFPALIEREDMMSAVSLTTIIWQATRMVMPAVGGVVIAVSDTWLLFAICSLGFVAMFAALLTLKVRAAATDYLPKAQSAITEMAEGFRFILTDRVFLTLMALSYTIMFFANSYMQMMPALAAMLGVAEQGYGLMLSVGGLGAIMGTVVSGALQHSHHLGRAMLGGAFMFCVLLCVFAGFALTGWAFAFPLALASLLMATFFASIFLVTSTTVMQLAVPDQLRGRVMGLHAVSYNLSTLGGLLAGYIASLTNPALAVIVNTSVFVAFLLWVVATQKPVRDIDGQTLNEHPA